MRNIHKQSLVKCANPTKSCRTPGCAVHVGVASTAINLKKGVLGICGWRQDSDKDRNAGHDSGQENHKLVHHS